MKMEKLIAKWKKIFPLAINKRDIEFKNRRYIRRWSVNR